MNKSNITSFSFTVEDDLISETSANTTFIQPKSFGKPKPFSKDYGPKGANGLNRFDQQPIPVIQRKIVEQAQIEAFKEMNNQLFNPFEHKLSQGFYGKQSDLYEREKQRQIQLIKKKEMEQLNSSKSYQIIFHNNPINTGNSLKMAANNILDEQSVPSIGDYYKKKFQKDKPIELKQIDQQHENQDIKRDNFVRQKDSKGSQRTVNSKGSQTRLPSKQKYVKKDNKIESEKEKGKLIKIDGEWKRQLTDEERNTPDVSTFSQKKVSEKETHPQLPKPPQKPYSSKTIKENKPILQEKQSLPSSKTKDSKKLVKQQKSDKKLYSQAYEGPDRNLVQQLERQIIETTSISFDDIAQLETAKGLLQEAVLLPRMMPQFFKGIRRAMKGILLFGPPGTGKTLLAKAVAAGNMFFNVSASSLASKWKGQSEKMVLFQMARFHAPSVIFFDQIDCIASKRSQNEHESARKVKTELLVQMDGVGSSQKEVFVLAATNRPWDLDEALRRRLEKRIYIPLPGKVGRKKMFEINMKELKVSKNVDWDKVIELTNGCSGADICNICRDAAYMPMRRKIQQIGGINKISEISQKDLLEEEISFEDILQSSKKTRPSVNGADLKKYSDWMKEFGST